MDELIEREAAFRGEVLDKTREKNAGLVGQDVLVRNRSIQPPNEFALGPTLIFRQEDHLPLEIGDEACLNLAFFGYVDDSALPSKARAFVVRQGGLTIGQRPGVFEE